MIRKINWKQPKYMLPAIALLPLLFVGYQVCSLAEGTEKVDNSVVTTDVNTDLPAINKEGTSIKGKYDAMLQNYGKVIEYTAVEGTEKEEDTKMKTDLLYSDEEIRRIDSVSAAQKAQAKELQDMLEQQKRNMQRSQQNVVSRRQAQEDRRIRDNEELEALSKRMQIIQQATSGKPVLTEEEKQAARLKELEAKEQKRIQDSIALANAPVAVNKAGQAGEDHFNTVVNNDENPSLIRARVDEFVKVKNGSRIRIRLNEDIEIDGEVLKGSYLYATVDGFSAQRVKATVSSIKLGDKIKKVNLIVYDLDCMEGFYVPESSFRELAKDVGSSAMNMNMNINSTGEQNLESMAMQTLQQALSATTSALSNNIKQNKAKIKFNTEIYLVDESSK